MTDDRLPPIPPSSSPVSRVGTPIGKSRSRSGSLVVATVVPPVPPLSIGGPRDGTPVKMYQRDSTPDAGTRPRSGSATHGGSGSAPRSSSAARALSASRVNLAKAVFEAQTPTSNTRTTTRRSGSVRHLSRRQLRRQENDDALRGGSYRLRTGTELDDDDEDALEQQWDSMIRSLKIDWRSQFSKLFESGNEDAMEAFRKCVGGVDVMRGASFGTNRRYRRMDEWMEAEAAWINVEKRLRTVTLRCLKERPDLKLGQFLLAMEVVVLYFCEMADAPPMSILPDGMRDILASPLTTAEVTVTKSSRRHTTNNSNAKNAKKKNKASVGKKGAKGGSKLKRDRSLSVGSSSSSISAAATAMDRHEADEGKCNNECKERDQDKVEGMEEDQEEAPNTKVMTCLRITLRESGLHRLLLHALCQFYSLKCKSYDDREEKQREEENSRSSWVTLPENINAKKHPMLFQKVSFAGYLEVCTGEGSESEER